MGSVGRSTMASLLDTFTKPDVEEEAKEPELKVEDKDGVECDEVKLVAGEVVEDGNGERLMETLLDASLTCKDDASVRLADVTLSA